MIRALSLNEIDFVSGGDDDGGYYEDPQLGDDSGGGFGDWSDFGSDSDVFGDSTSQAYTDPDTGDIVVTGHQPPQIDIGNGQWARYYSDGIAIVGGSGGGESAMYYTATTTQSGASATLSFSPSTTLAE